MITPSSHQAQVRWCCQLLFEALLAIKKLNAIIIQDTKGIIRNIKCSLCFKRIECAAVTCNRKDRDNNREPVQRLTHRNDPSL